MKILLTALNAKFIHSNLAIRSIARYAQVRRGICCGLLEFTINQELDFILSQLFEQRPDVIGFSCYIWNIEPIKRLVRELKKVLPETIVILGGPEVSYNSTDILAEVPADYVLCGEGEESFCQLVESIQRGSVADVKSLTRRLDGKPLSSSPAPALPLAEIPFAYEDLKGLDHRILYYESSRGCPYRCGYCLSSIQPGVRFLPLDRVFSDLRFFLERKVPQVKFVDRTFNCNRTHALAIWRFLRDNDNGVTNFHFEINANALDEEAVALLSTLRRGLVQLEIGIQTTNQGTLKEIHRSNDFARITAVVERLRRAGNMHLHLDLIAGLPGEGYASFAQSFHQVYALRPDQLQLGFLKVLKGSDIALRRQELGIVCRDMAPYEVLFTRELDFAEMLRLKRIEAMVEQYYNSNRYKKCISYLETLFPSPFALFEALAQYYHDQGHHLAPHKHTESYSILRAFLLHTGRGDAVRFEWLAKYDLFSHEKAKSLPGWLTADLTAAHKREIYAFFNDAAVCARLLPEYSGYDPRQIHRMAHLEIFPFNPLSGEEKETAVLFNYRRNDLLGNAHSEVVVLPTAHR